MSADAIAFILSGFAFKFQTYVDARDYKEHSIQVYIKIIHMMFKAQRMRQNLT